MTLTGFPPSPRWPLGTTFFHEAPDPVPPDSATSSPCPIYEHLDQGLGKELWEAAYLRSLVFAWTSPYGHFCLSDPKPADSDWGLSLNLPHHHWLVWQLLDSWLTLVTVTRPALVSLFRQHGAVPLLGEVSACACLSSCHLCWLQAHPPCGAAALAAAGSKNKVWWTCAKTCMSRDKYICMSKTLKQYYFVLSSFTEIVGFYPRVLCPFFVFFFSSVSLSYLLLWTSNMQHRVYFHPSTVWH